MLQVLREGAQGPAVSQWQTFLRGQDFYACEASGTFDATTLEATRVFQKSSGLEPDGVVGPHTYAKALRLGFNILVDNSESEGGPNWPPDTGTGPLTLAAKQKRFGAFTYTSAPVASNPEAIQIGGTWVKDNIVRVVVPQLEPFVTGGIVLFHKDGAEQLKALFAAWEADGLLGHILSWDGAWVPRFVRGSRTTLSNHSFGTAFDINARWNALSTCPALVGTKGSVRELVARANEIGFYWGGYYGYPKGFPNASGVSGRSDGMHFELA